LFGCQQVLIHIDKDTQAIIEYLCSESNKVFNCAVYYARQVYFKAHRYATKKEASYTSKTSFVDGDYLPQYGEKPDNSKPSGKPVKRGLYRTALNWYINADCNGAGNILRKVATMLGFNLSGVGRVPLTAPQRIKLWSAKKTRRDGVSTRPEVSA